MSLCEDTLTGYCYEFIFGLGFVTEYYCIHNSVVVRYKRFKVQCYVSQFNLYADSSLVFYFFVVGSS